MHWLANGQCTVLEFDWIPNASIWSNLLLGDLGFVEKKAPAPVEDVVLCNLTEKMANIVAVGVTKKKVVLDSVPGPSPTLPSPNKPPKKEQEPEHKHELIVLSHLVKRRLRGLIRTLQSKKQSLHLKRQYKRAARQRKLFRRSENERKRKVAEKAALKKLAKDFKDGDGKGGKGGKSQEGGKGASTKSADEKSKKGREGVLKAPGDRWKPAERRQKWRENKYRKWRKIRMRAKFTQQERAHRLFDQQHPGTRPFVSRNFGRSKSEFLVRQIHKERLSSRWSAMGVDLGTSFAMKFLPEVNPNMEQLSRPYSKREAKQRFRGVLKDEWQLANHDRLRDGQLVKAMAVLMVDAKERYDSERKRTEVSENLGLCVQAWSIVRTSVQKIIWF